MLVDEAIIHVRSGRGGDGSPSLHREKFVPKGGPDGGDGGRGGDVVLVADEHLDTLLGFLHTVHHRAEHGQNGMKNCCHGKAGGDCIVRVPLGTVVHDADTDEFIVDVSDPADRIVVVKGGRGGLGNVHFKSSTHQTPREFTPGGPVVERRLRLELKLIADIGLVGKPNAGKSTLLRAISRATPKVANYPFTTLSPQVGVTELSDDRRLVVADIPGLIEGAATGAGLGHDFLRHIERTRAVVHVIDVAPEDGSDPAANYHAIRQELFDYSTELAEKQELIALNKIDLVPIEERPALISRLAGALGLPRGETPLVISGAAREGLGPFLEACWQLASKHRRVTWGRGEVAERPHDRPTDPAPGEDDHDDARKDGAVDAGAERRS